MKNKLPAIVFLLALVVRSFAAPPVLTGPSNVTILEDAARTNLTFTVTDPDTAIFAVSVEASSSNPSVIDTADIFINGAGTSRTLSLVPIADTNGSATITVIATDDNLETVTNSFTVTVSAVNDTPDLQAFSPLTILEEATTNITYTVSDVDTALGSVTNSATSSDTSIATVAVSGSGSSRTLTIITVSNAFGTATISVAAHDGAASTTNSFLLTVTGVNDAPSFSLSTNKIDLAEDAGAQSVTNFATSISRGPTNENAQTVTFVVTTTNTAFFSTQPSINSTGLLAFCAATNVFGTNYLSVALQDNGGTANGGSNQATAQTFTIVVAGANDAPLVSTIAGQTILEDSGSNAVSFTVNDVDDTLSGVTNSVTSANTNLVTVTVSGNSTNRTVALTTVTNANGNTTVTLITGDAAATVTNTFNVIVTAVNDVPSFSLSTNQVTVAEDAGAQTVTNFATSISSGPTNESAQTLTFTVTATNTAFFTTQPSINSTGNLAFRVATNVFGTNYLTVHIADSGGTQNSGTNVSANQSFTIVVNGANDAPTIATISPQTILEDSGSNAVLITINDVDTTLTNVTTTVTSANTNLVTVAVSGTSTNRTLAITTVTNAFGTATITVVANDGSASATNSFVLTVTGVNDAPSFTLPTNQVTVVEDATAQSITSFATSISRGPTNENAQTLTFTVTATNTAFFSTQPSINSTGTLSFRTATNVFGTNYLSVVLSDNGGSQNGGTNAAAAQNFSIVVTSSNDAPAIATIAAQTILEDSGSNNVNFIVTDVDTTVTNVTITATSLNTNLVIVSASGTATNRSLALTTVTNANGSTTIRVVADDGSRTSTNTFTVNVTAVNDAPSFSLATNQITAGEDAGLSYSTNLATSISRGPTNENSQRLTFILTTTNTAFFTTQPAITTNGLLSFKTATNVFGTNYLTVRLTDSGDSLNGGTNGSAPQALEIVVTGVNDAPTMTVAATATINEDSGSNNVSFTVADVDTTITNVTVTVTSANTNLATVSVSGTSTNRSLAITTVTNASGTTTITLVANDGSASRTNTLALTVATVNDAPSFTLSTNQVTVAEDAGARSVTNFVTNISKGPTNETSQTLVFLVTSTNTSFFATQPAISAAGLLTFRTATNVFGTNTITVRLQDNGGSTLGGTNASAPQTFEIAATPVNDAPSISAIAAQTINEDSGTNNVSFIVSDPDGTVTNVTTTATTANTNLITVSVSGTATNRTVQLITVTNAIGVTTVTLVADDGSASRTNTFTVTVKDVNDAPRFTLTTNEVYVVEDAGLSIVTNYATGISAGPTNESAQKLTFIVTTTNSTFFSTQPVINSTGTMSFRTATNAFGTNYLTVRLQDNGSTTLGGTNASAPQSFSIIATPVNDAPSLGAIAAQTINEDSGTNTINFTVNDPDGTVTNITVTATSGNTNLVTVSTGGTATNRTLQAVTVTNATGATTITLITDDGSASRTNTFLLTVAPVNDAPSFTLTTNYLRVTKFGTVQTVANFATNISAGPTNEAAQKLTFVVTTTNAAFFSKPPVIAANGTLTFTAGGQSGSNYVTVRLTDNGGFAHGGTNSSASQTFVVYSPANPYNVLKGTFNGLFYNTSTFGPESSGYFTFVMTANGTFSGSVNMGGTYAMSGQFDSAGVANINVARAGTNALAVAMSLDLSTNFTETVNGTVSNGTWTATLAGDRAPFNAVNNPAPQAGKYTLVFDISLGGPPAGVGFGTVSVDTAGKVKFAGTLGDGTVVSQSSSISRNGEWPLYVSLYKKKGLAIGWMTITNAGQSTTLGQYYWHKDADSNAVFYPSGFDVTQSALSSTFTPASAGTRVVNAPTGTAEMRYGGLSADFASGITLSTNNIITVDAPATNALTLSVSASSGLITGSFTHPDTGKKVSVKGVVIQQTGGAVGFDALGLFVSTNQTGLFRLQ
ncbi:MAG: hypothetical protein HOP33_01630 [Verrucomicrobia bacterium]|nr:hypothetical protein [Verrucomicrobiota bacterium]